MNTTELYQKMIATEAAFTADDRNLDKMHAADAAFKAYHDARIAARNEWNALPAGDAKDSAETNAFDTEGCLEDELRWFQIAIGTWEMM